MGSRSYHPSFSSNPLIRCPGESRRPTQKRKSLSKTENTQGGPFLPKLLLSIELKSRRYCMAQNKGGIYKTETSVSELDPFQLSTWLRNTFIALSRRGYKRLPRRASFVRKDIYKTRCRRWDVECPVFYLFGVRCNFGRRDFPKELGEINTNVWRSVDVGIVVSSPRPRADQRRNKRDCRK